MHTHFHSIGDSTGGRRLGSTFSNFAQEQTYIRFQKIGLVVTVIISLVEHRESASHVAGTVSDNNEDPVL